MYVWNRLVGKKRSTSVRRPDAQRCHSEYLNSEELEKLKPKLLSGEVIVSRASKIVGGDLCGCLEEDRVGELIVTNFRIIFCPYSEKEEENPVRKVMQRNKLIGNNDIALYNVDTVYSVKKKKRKLIQNGIVPRHLKVIEINCKDFRVHFFHLKLLNEKNEASLLLSAILNGAFPLQLSSLFAFHYDIEFGRDDFPRFNSEQEWKELLERKGALGAFRIVQCNKDFRESDSLPEYFAVASSLTESEIIRSGKMFSNNRCPVWSYTHSNGASVVRMASSIPGVGEELEIRMTEHVQRSNGGGGGGGGGGGDAECLVLDLSRRLPSLLEIQQSYESLQSLCMPGSLKDFWLSDAVWLSSLESSRWLSSVGCCLELANEAADSIIVGKTVVLKEVDAVDFAPLVSCLIQLIVDAEVRTVDGFERLVEREWVALGHKFAERYGNCQHEKTDIKSSVFLLFLDCVWQIVRQFPSEIQFTEYFLVSVWDSVCIGIFRNFLFNNMRSSHSLPPKTPSHDLYITRLQPPSLPSVWDWGKQFSDDRIALFFSPLYVFLHDDALNDQLINISANDSGLSLSFDSKSSKTKDACLKPNAKIPHLQFWSLCYLRWLPAAEVMGGGPACEYLSQCILVEEILYLCQTIEMETADAKRCRSRRSSRLIFGSNGNGAIAPPRSVSVSSSFPFGRPADARFGPGIFIDSYFKSSVLYSHGAPTSDDLDD